MVDEPDPWILPGRAHLPQWKESQSRRWGIDQYGQSAHDVSHKESVLIHSTPPNGWDRRHEKVSSDRSYHSETPTPKSRPMANQPLNDFSAASQVSSWVIL